MSESLFEVPVPPPDPPQTHGEKARARQRALIAAGWHPLTRGPLHPDATLDATPGTKVRGTCGTCCHRQYETHHAKAYPKCRQAGPVTHGAGTDVPAWWPACLDYLETP